MWAVFTFPGHDKSYNFKLSPRNTFVPSFEKMFMMSDFSHCVCKTQFWNVKRAPSWSLLGKDMYFQILAPFQLYMKPAGVPGVAACPGACQL